MAALNSWQTRSHDHHVYNAQHVFRTPQAVALETSLIMQMCLGMSGDSILSIMNTYLKLMRKTRILKIRLLEIILCPGITH